MELGVGRGEVYEVGVMGKDGSDPGFFEVFKKFLLVRLFYRGGLPAVVVFGEYLNGVAAGGLSAHRGICDSSGYGHMGPE